MNNLELARKCLEWIRDTAGRGASSWDPNVIGYALQELSQVLYERTGVQERAFEPVAPDEIYDLPALLEELDFVDSLSQSMASMTGFN